MTEGCIDAVFTWVDGSDPAHKRKRQQFLPTVANCEDLHYRATEETRFADSGELWYSVHLARHHAPWIRNIFIVTDEQVPHWATPSVRDQLGIVLIDHRDLFSGYEEYLPTFSSRTIEAMLHRIDGLSDRFIYFNDDMFLLRPITPSFFFEDKKPIFRGQWDYTSKALKRLAKALGLYRSTPKGLNRFKPEVWSLPGKRFFRLAHSPYPVFRPSYALQFQDESFQRSIISHRFRGAHQPWPIGLYANWTLRNGQGMSVHDGWAYLPDSGKLKNTVASQLKIIDASGASTLCIQSMDSHAEADRKQLYCYLSRVLRRERLNPASL